MISLETVYVTKLPLLIIVGIIAGIVLFLLILSFVLLTTFEKSFKKRISDKSNTIRVFVVDVKNDKVNYFNSSKLRGRKSSTIPAFYHQFAASEREKLISWINDLLDKVEGVKNSMEIQVIIRRRKKTLVSLLKVQKIDYENQIIYFESHLLNYSLRRSITNESGSFVTKELFARSFHAHNAKGFSFCFNFFNKITKTNNIEHLSMLEIKNILIKFISEDVIMFAYDTTKVVVANYSIEDKIQAMSFIQNVKNKINSYLLIGSLANEIDLSVGTAENLYFYRDVKGLCKCVSGLADYAKDNNQLALFFDQNSSDIGATSSFKTEVENIIANEKLVYKYQPVLDAQRRRPFGYLSIVDAPDSIFKSLVELKNFALRTDDDQQLFTTIFKNAVTNFVQERNLFGLKLFMPITLNEIQYVNRTLSHIVDISQVNIVLILDENEISNSLGLDTISFNYADLIRNMKSFGFEVAIRFDDDVVSIPTNLMPLFDYFILPTGNFIGENANKGVPQFKELIEKLLKYEKPMISIEIPNWDVVELVYKFGINILCGEGIAAPNENILPIDKKVIARFKKLDE